MYKVICSNIAGHIKPTRLKTIVMQPIELHVAYLGAEKLLCFTERRKQKGKGYFQRDCYRFVVNTV